MCSLFDIASTEVTRNGDELTVSSPPEAAKADMDGTPLYRMQIKGLHSYKGTPQVLSYGDLVGLLPYCERAPEADDRILATRCHRYVDFFVKRVP